MAEGSIAADELRLLIERIEDEKKHLGDEVKDVYAEAKARGYDARIHAPDRPLAEDGDARSPGDGSDPGHVQSRVGVA